MAEVRSVTVRLDADVAGYIAKMKLAGDATDRAFGRSSTGIQSTNSELSRTESTLQKVDSAARRTETSMGRLGSTARRTSENDFTKAANAVDGFLGKLGAIPALAIAGGAALVPLAAAATGVVAAFAAPLAFTGGAVTLFTLLGGAAISQTQKEFKNLDKLQKAVVSARLSLEQSTRSAGKNASTSASVANAQQRYNKALKEYHQALQGISPQQRQFHGALETLKSDFQKFLRGPTGQDLLGPFTKGLQVADDLLPKSAPLIHAVSGSLTDLLGELDKYANTPGFDRFIHKVSATVGPDLKALGHIVGDVAPGVGNLLLVMDHRLSHPLIHDLEQMAKTFGHFASSKQGRHDVMSFIDYFHKVGPDAAQTVWSIARGAGHLVKALAPLGPPVLHTVKGVMDAFNSVPIPVLTALAGTAAALVTLQKLGGFKLAGFIGGQAFGKGSNPLTGGSGPLGGITKGVVPVYVTNKGFGAPGVPKVPGVPDVPPGEAAGPLQWALPITAAVAIGAAIHQGAYDAARSIWGKIPGGKTAADLAFKIPGQVGLPGFGGQLFSAAPHLNPVQVLHGIGNAFTWLGHVASETFKPIPHEVEKSIGTPLDALHQRLSKASQGMELVGHSADRAFNGSAKDVTNLSSKLQSVKTAPAQQQMELVGTAAQRGFSKAGAAADQLQGHVNNLHGKQIDVTVNGGQSLAVLRSIAAEEAAIRSKTISITTIHSTGGRSMAGSADGSTVPKTGLPYADRHPYLLADGEEVISNRYGQADRHRGLLKAINAGRLANGGTAGFAGAGATTAHLTPQQAADLRAARGVRGELHKLELQLKAVNLELDKEKQKRQALVQAEQQLSSTITTNFRNPIWGVQPTTGIWSAAASSMTDPASILRTDIRNARRFRHDLLVLRHRGLSAGAEGDIQTLDQAEQAMGLKRGELRLISRLYGERQRASRAAGQVAGQLRYGKQIEAQTRDIHRTAAEAHQLNQQVKEANHRLGKIEHAVKVDGPKATGQQLNKPAQKAARRARP